MKIVFMGTPDFAAQSLKVLMQSSHNVVAVVTAPDKPKGRGQKVMPSPVKILAAQNGLPVMQPLSLKDERFIQQLKSLHADIFVVVAFRILPPEVFTIPPRRTVNIHASLLPKYRGAAPINWAIINGETETGVTSMLIDEKVDTGNILLQEKTEIGPEMTAGELHDKLAVLGAQLLLRTLAGLEKKLILPVAQDNIQASKAPKITKELGHINFKKPVKQVHNLIRGLSPHPAAYCYHKENLLKVFRSKIVFKQSKTEPGTISGIGKDYFDVSCIDGQIRVTEVQIQGRRRMSVRDFLNGYILNRNDILS